MPHFLNHHLTPAGEKLAGKKGIIYVPYTHNGTNYSQQLKSILSKAQICCFEINSDEPDSQDNLQVYKNYQNSPNPTKILICKGMAKIGFSDNETEWIINLQKSDAAGFYQAAGRAMRWLDDKKIAYIIAFNDAELALVFNRVGITADDDALIRCAPSFKAQRTSTKRKRYGDDYDSTDLLPINKPKSRHTFFASKSNEVDNQSSSMMAHPQQPAEKHAPLQPRPANPKNNSPAELGFYSHPSR